MGDELIVIGRIGTKKYLVTIEPHTHKQKIVEFPDIELIDVRIENYGGNLFIKTRDALLFLYNDSKKIEWLIDGQILAFSRYGALYYKDESTWQANWN